MRYFRFFFLHGLQNLNVIFVLCIKMQKLFSATTSLTGCTFILLVWNIKWKRVIIILSFWEWNTNPSTFASENHGNKHYCSEVISINKIEIETLLVSIISELQNDSVPLNLGKFFLQVSQFLRKRFVILPYFWEISHLHNMWI